MPALYRPAGITAAGKHLDAVLDFFDTGARVGAVFHGDARCVVRDVPRQGGLGILHADLHVAHLESAVAQPLTQRTANVIVGAHGTSRVGIRNAGIDGRYALSLHRRADGLAARGIVGVIGVPDGAGPGVFAALLVLRAVGIGLAVAILGGILATRVPVGPLPRCALLRGRRL